jgi:factor associated with neutral sphingomyelinase activation
MFTQPASHNRFNLLLLSENEHYFSDYAAIFYPNCATDSESIAKQIKGRLKVCSRSIFFDPEDSSFPIIRYDYKDVAEVEPLRVGVIHQMNNGETFYVKTSKMVQMKENNMIGPYVFQTGEVLHRFAIKYVSTKVMLDEVKRLWSIARQTGPYEVDDRIRRMIEEREMKVSFDLTWMASLDERILVETLANKITPLVSNAGRLLVTNKMVYFQPLNNVAATPVEKLSLKDCVRVVKRRHELRPLAIEIFCEDLSVTSHNDSSVTANFFTFRDSNTRDKVFDTLTNIPGMTRLEHENQSQTTWKWQCGLISNYEYLMYLNSLAHRSFNDLTQYPVFPWVIADYTSSTLNLDDPNTFRDLSKPIGALSADRLASFRRRFAEMPSDQERFMYGTHYSTPAYVLYYLVRIAPEYMLKLQNGRFDEAERLFNSIEDTWQNVLKNSADLKELIPEFFSSDLGGRMGGEFLCNHQDINFGRRADGTAVGDVALPPWAKGNASEFVRLNREALECDYVSSRIHHWIDLIFGFQQRGPEAIKADNLFHPLTYEGAVDIEREHDPVRRSAILIQINEFGQTPARIFDQPHPSRFSPDERRRMRESSSASSGTSGTYGASGTSQVNSSASSSQTPFASRSSPYSSHSGSSASLPLYSPSSSLTSLPPYVASSGSASSTSNAPATPSSHAPRAFGSLNSSFGSRETPSNQTWRSERDTLEPIPISSFAPVVSTAADPTIDQLLGQLRDLSTSPFLIDKIPPLESKNSDSLNLSGIPGLSAHSSSHGSISSSSQTSAMATCLSAVDSKTYSHEPAAGRRNFGLSDSWAGFAQYVPIETWKPHRQGVSSICLSSDGETLYSVSQDSSLKIYSLGENRQLRSNNISQLALSSCVLSEDQKYVAIGAWDNNIYLYSNDYGRVVTTIQAHDDTVSCLALRETILVSGSWDTSMKIWSILPTGLSPDPLIELSCLDSAVRTVHLNLDGNLALCGSEDGMLAIADTRTGSVVRTWSAHEDAISAAQFTNDGRIISCSSVGTMKVQEPSTKDIFSIEIPNGFNCLTTNGTKLLTGDASSTVRTWDLLIGEEISRTKRTSPNESPITCIAPSERADCFITGSEDGTLTKWAKK